MNQAPPNSDVLVLGAGLAGVSAALALGGGYRLVERESRPGGLCRTDVRDGFTHDVTGHWLHLRYPDVLALAHEVLPGGWLTVQRRAAIRSSGVFTRYPYQVNTQGLPPEVVAENVLGFIDAHLGEGGRELRERVPRNFAEFVLRHLGAGIARNFIFPYNEKCPQGSSERMTSPQAQMLISRAEESHQPAKVLLDQGFPNFSAAQSYYTMFYLTEALLFSKDMQFSSHSAVIAAYGKEFAKTGLLDPKFHRRLIVAERRRETGHYGEESSVTHEEARESFQWADEFIQVVKVFLRG